MREGRSCGSKVIAINLYSWRPANLYLDTAIMSESFGNRIYQSLIPQQKAHDCWKLSYVLGGGRESTQTRSIMCVACTAWNGR
jgi:hypothetical protein